MLEGLLLTLDIVGMLLLIRWSLAEERRADELERDKPKPPVGRR
jgi:hypothetical protein